MKSDIILFLVISTVFFAFFCTPKIMHKNSTSNFTFMYEVPILTEDQKGFIQRNYCKIFSEIPEPYVYFVKEIIVDDIGTTVKLGPLSSLQAGYNSKKTEIVFVSGKSWFVYFDKEEHFLRIEEK